MFQKKLVLELGLTTTRPYTFAVMGTDGLPVFTTIHDGKVETLGFAQASGVKSILRHIASTIFHQALHPDSTVIFDDVEAYYFSTIGGVKGKKEKDEQPFDLLQGRPLLIENHTVVSTWGCMAPVSIQGKITVDHMLSDLKIAKASVVKDGAADKTVQDGAMHLRASRNDSLQRTSNLHRISPDVHDQWVRKYAATGRQSDLQKQLKTLKKQAEKTAGTDKAAIEAEIKRVDEEIKNTNVALQQPALDTFALPPNTPLKGDITLTDPTDVEVGLLLRALLAFGLDPKMGGKAAMGCGGYPDMTVKAKMITYDIMTGQGAVADLGSFATKRDEVTVNLPPALQHYVDAWNDHALALATGEAQAITNPAVIPSLGRREKASA